jgi:D-alanyl-D-alanine carboxypeptidase
VRRAVLCVALAAAAAACAAGSPDARRVEAAIAAVPSLPAEMAAAIRSDRDAFVRDLSAAIASDRDGLLVRVDKARRLGAGYRPDDLVPLAKGRSYLPGRDGLSLRAPAERALDEMARAARADGVTLVASSSFRSFEYQEKLYDRNVRELGKAAADRESAPPGASQHQLGTAVDFGSITDDFALTRAGRWLAANAGSWGWSLSFPDGYEGVTGYRWECWHFRYVGREAVALQNRWFGGVQQWMIEFVDAWLASGPTARPAP